MHNPCCLVKGGNKACAVRVSRGTGAGARAWVARVAGIYTLADDFKPSTAICDLDFRAAAAPSAPPRADRGSRGRSLLAEPITPGQVRRRWLRCSSGDDDSSRSQSLRGGGGKGRLGGTWRVGNLDPERGVGGLRSGIGRGLVGDARLDELPASAPVVGA